MAYVQSSSSGQRMATIGGVAIIHAGLGIAMVTGLATDGFSLPPVRFTAQNYAATPPDALPAEPPKHDYVPPRTSTSDTIKIFDIGSATLPPLDRFIPDPGPGLAPASDPVTPPAKPILATPRGDPGRWIGHEDYPTSALRRNLEGVVRFELTVTPEGQVASCRISASSGHEELDAATCRLVTERARFKSTRDAAGNKVSAQYTQSVRWEIKP